MAQIFVFCPHGTADFSQSLESVLFAVSFWLRLCRAGPSAVQCLLIAAWPAPGAMELRPQSRSQMEFGSERRSRRQSRLVLG